MKVLVQRVKKAVLYVEGNLKGEIGRGMVVFVGVGKNDKEEDSIYLANKVYSLRIFEDSSGKMTYSLNQIDGEIMIVSQFTLYGDCRKGNRPDFTKAEKSQIAYSLYKKFLEEMEKKEIKKIVSGEFGKKMLVEIHNDGPVTLIIESKNENKNN